MKGIRWLAPVLALAVVACGDDGSVQSPDFTPELIELEVTPATATIGAGDSVTLTATGTFTAQPGEDPPTEARQVTPHWSVDDEALASVEVGEDGEAVVTGLHQGQVEVFAELDGLEVSSLITIEAPLLEQIVIEPDPVSVPLGAEVAVRGLGVYSDDGAARELDDDTVVAWASANPLIASALPATGRETTVTGIAVGETTLTATTTNADGVVVTETVEVSVTDAVLTGVAAVEPETATIAAGLTQEFTAIGNYSDGSTATIPDTIINWESSDELVASINADGVATGQADGTVTITATLRDLVMPGVEDRSAEATLSVASGACLSRMLASNGATVEVETGPNLLQCLGCIVDDEINVVDDDFDNFAKMIVPVGLLNGYIHLTVTASDGTFAAGTQPGFVIARPANALLSAEVLSQLTVTTLLDGQEVESSTDVVPLRLTLLGQLGNDTLALATLPEPATREYDAVRLSFASGIASALSSTNVYAACTSTDLPGE